MDHYLGIFVSREKEQHRLYFQFDSKNEKSMEKTSLLTFNLRDHTVNEVFVECTSLKIPQGSRFLRYNENPLIKYCGNYKNDFSLTCITIESFERILLISKAYPKE